MGQDGLAQAHTPHRLSLLQGVTAAPASDLSDKITTSLLTRARQLLRLNSLCWAFPSLLSLLFPALLLLVLQLGPAHTILSWLVLKSAAMAHDVSAEWGVLPVTWLGPHLLEVLLEQPGKLLGTLCTPKKCFGVISFASSQSISP